VTPGESGLLFRAVRFSIRFRRVTIAAASLLAGYGAYALSHARYDVFPEFAPPQAVVQTEAPGFSPEQVESLVTQPVENQLNGAPGLASLRSSSIQGLSVVTLTFRPETDVYRDRQIVSERLGSVTGTLPQSVRFPTLTPLTSSTSVALIAGLTSRTRSLMELRTIADWTIRPRLLAVAGVAKVAVFGGEKREIQIQIDPDRLIRFNVGVNDVDQAARRAAGQRAAGFISTVNQRIVLQTQGERLTPHQIARTLLVYHDDVPVTLGDVAHVTYGSQPAAGAASIRGEPGVMLIVSEQYGASTLQVTEGTERALRDLRPALESEDVVLHDDLFRPANFIRTATRNVRSALLLGAVLVILVLLLFLADVRTAAVSCAAIPLSLLGAVIVLERLGLTLNTMTLGGLAIAIGEVVDDAVIDVENIVRRLRQNLLAGRPRTRWRVVLGASLEVRSAVVYATLAVVLVFFPILALSGTAGRLFAPLGAAYVLAVLASLLVAVFVTPALSMMLLGSRELRAAEPPILRWMKARYADLLGRIERHPAGVMTLAAILLVGGLAMIPFFGATFIPELKEGHFIVHMAAVPGTSLQESLRIGRRVTKALLDIPGVRTVSQRVGRAEESDDVLGTQSSELNVDLEPSSGDEAERVASAIRSSLSQFPGVRFAVNTFLTERMEETLSGYTAPVVVNLYGQNLDELDSSAAAVARLLERTPGATDVQVQSPAGMPELSVRLRPADLERWGFAPLDVLDAVHTAYGGDVVGQLQEGSRPVDLSVILDPQRRRSVKEVGALPLRSPSGAYVQLARLADVFETTGRYQILHNGARRVQAVTCAVIGRDVGSFVRDLRHRISSSLRLPAGTYLEFSGAAQEASRSRRDLLVNSLVAGVAILLLLSMVTRHWRNLLLLLLNLPFALMGGVFAVFATGGILSLGSMVGFVTLFGITLRNGIMMISHFEHLVQFEGMEWGIETAIQGATDRLAPILMTSFVTGLGLLPLAIGMQAPGREIEGPLALVILGGLATSMILNLTLLPALALRFGRFERSLSSEEEVFQK
jgi:CzcA family heavy metal efflux pump